MEVEKVLPPPTHNFATLAAMHGRAAHFYENSAARKKWVFFQLRNDWNALTLEEKS